MQKEAAVIHRLREAIELDNNCVAVSPRPLSQRQSFFFIYCDI